MSDCVTKLKLHQGQFSCTGSYREKFNITSTRDIKICFGSYKDTLRVYNSLRTFLLKLMFVIEEQGLLRLVLNKKENNHVLIKYDFIYVYILLQSADLLNMMKTCK